MNTYNDPIMTSKTFRLRYDIVQKLKEEANRQEASEATIVRQALAAYFKSKETV